MGTSIGAGITYVWTDENGAVVSTDLFPTIDLAGIYTLTVIDTNTGQTASDSVLILEDTSPPFTEIFV